MFRLANREKIAWLTPGRSGTPSIVMRASSLTSAAPQTGLLGRFRLGDDHRARHVAETAANVDRHVELLGEFDRAAVHHAGAEAGQLQHFVVADAFHAACFGQLARIGRVDAVDVGVNLAGIGTQHGRQGHGRGVAAAAAERGDVEILVDALKAGGDHDVAFVQQLAHAVGRDRMNAGLGVRAVGADADLCTGEADGFGTERLDGHRHQRHADLLAGRKEHVHFAGVGAIGDLPGQIDQMIGLMAHRADDHHDLVALLLGANRFAGGGENFLAIGNAGAAEFLDNDGHELGV